MLTNGEGATQSLLSDFTLELWAELLDLENLVCEVIHNHQSQTSLQLDSETPHYGLACSIF